LQFVIGAIGYIGVSYWAGNSCSNRTAAYGWPSSVPADFYVHEEK
jgi:hypothetical protein